MTFHRSEAMQHVTLDIFKVFDRPADVHLTLKSYEILDWVFSLILHFSVINSFIWF